MAAVGVHTSSCYFIINLLIFISAHALYPSIKEKVKSETALSKAKTKENRRERAAIG